MRRQQAVRLTVSGLFIALLAVCAQIYLPLPMVPVNLALLAVYLCAALLPPSRAMLTVAAYVLMGVMGLPVFAGLRGGLAVLLDRTGGFLLGYVLAAGIISRMIHGGDGSFRSVCGAFGIGTLVCYALGTAWFSLVTGMNLVHGLAWCVLPFLPGDAAKIVLAAMLSRRLRRPLARWIR